MRLTPAEKQALDAVGKYGDVKAAAWALGKSPYTIDAQCKSARRKLNARSTLHAYALSRELP